MGSVLFWDQFHAYPNAYIGLIFLSDLLQRSMPRRMASHICLPYKSLNWVSTLFKESGRIWRRRNLMIMFQGVLCAADSAYLMSYIIVRLRALRIQRWLYSMENSHRQEQC